MPNALTKKLQGLMYAFGTNDRYADYDSKSSIPNSQKLTSPVLETSFNSPQMALYSEFDIHSAGVSEVMLSWRHIEMWANKHYPDLLETLNPPVTRNDVSGAEKDLGISLPPLVVASLRIHDGQDRLGSFRDVCGLIYTLELMLLDKIVEMTKNWRRVSDRINGLIQQQLSQDVSLRLQLPELTHNRNIKTSIRKQSGPQYQTLERSEFEMDPNLESDLGATQVRYDVSDVGESMSTAKKSLQRQRSVPPGAVHDTYAHRDWIPLVTDNAGNHVAVDLLPGATGKMGQIILFGREFDTKYVVAPTWGDFLLGFARDLESGSFLLRSDELVDDIMASEGELVYYDKYKRQEVSYFEVLKERAVKYWKSHSPVGVPEEEVEEANPLENGDVSTQHGYTYDESELLDAPEFPSFGYGIEASSEYIPHLDDTLDSNTESVVYTPNEATSLGPPTEALVELQSSKNVTEELGLAQKFESVTI